MAEATQGTIAAVAQNQAPIQPDQSREEGSGFFQEDNGTYSSMRLMCFVSLLAAIAFGALTILLSADGKTDANGIYITFGFLIGGFAPKAVQKFAEQKIPTKS